jgi:hypothetical protein
MKKYAYYLRDQEETTLIAFVENKTKTVRDVSTDWDTVTSILDYRIRANIVPDPILKDNKAVIIPFSRDGSGANAHDESEGDGHWLAECVLYGIISQGYEDPRNLQLELAQYFGNKANASWRMAKKTARRRKQRGGYIHPHEF